MKGKNGGLDTHSLILFLKKIEDRLTCLFFVRTSFNSQIAFIAKK